jgi:hypothetical protein
VKKGHSEQQWAPPKGFAMPPGITNQARNELAQGQVLTNDTRLFLITALEKGVNINTTTIY